MPAALPLPPDPQPGSDNIFLIGSRGTGKTTVARLLAARLGWAWADADDALEARHGRSIRRVFAEEGEAGFRVLEAGVLEGLCCLRRHVIATGGGVVLQQANRQRLRAAGRVVWLTADAATLWQRLCQDPATAERRPDLTVGGLAEIELLLAARAPLYHACADLRVDTTDLTPEEVARAVLSHWNRVG